MRMGVSSGFFDSFFAWFFGVFARGGTKEFVPSGQKKKRRPKRR